MIQRLPPIVRSLVWFGVVGATAALVHLLVYLLSRLWLRPELANVIGFVVAFGVSYCGHRWLTFSGSSAPVGRSLWRYLLTAIAGFCTNEITFVLLLWWTQWYEWIVLVCALLLAAVQTFILSRWWAFRHRRTESQ
ncbi:MAG TPA: GtrA family protein [Candidatus Acidoferrum sp.]|nr:GtrA family protein [Candidatus Acidoferrum sp.]